MQLKRFWIISFCTIVVLIAGCRRARVHRRTVNEDEARMVDVAFALDARAIKKEISPSTYAYYSNTTLEQLIKFYCNHMESFGWNLLAQNQAGQTLLVFEKPAKICVITLRPSGHHVSGHRVLVHIDYTPRNNSN